ncbi:MAG: hypothetical protein ACO1TE_12910 [Prosthecobacter sp.]
MNLHLWQSTALALLGLAVGLVLHLRWHPLRQELSDAWDFMRQRSVLVLWVAGALLLAEAVGGARMEARTLAQLTDWREVIGPLAREAAAHVALLPHGLIPPWPLSCLMPVLFTILTVRIWRWPYRYAKHRPGPEQKFALLTFTVLGFVWLGLEVAGAARGRMLAEWVEMLKLGLRYVFSALTAAGTQVWLVCFVLAWERPQNTEAENDALLALERTFARWQGVAWLAGFNLLWLGWRLWQGGVGTGIGTSAGLGGWVWIEFLLVFSALPVAVGTAAGSFFEQGAVALRLLFRAVVPLLLLGITAVAVFILALYASAMARALCLDAPMLRLVVTPLNALGLAMLDSWLLLTFLLLMLRHGFPRFPSSASASA